MNAKVPTPDKIAIGNLRRELARGSAELAVLTLLARSRRYGYELLKGLEAVGGGVLEVREGTLYPLLHRLEDAGQIEGSWEAEGRGRPRKYYALTRQGRERLALLQSEWRELIAVIARLLKDNNED